MFFSMQRYKKRLFKKGSLFFYSTILFYNYLRDCSKINREIYFKITFYSFLMLKIYLEFREQILDVGLYKLWYYQLSQICYFLC
jgi:hypothetical protein